MTDKELIQELRSKAEVEGAGSTRRLLELAARALEQRQWVSVKDRKPEDETVVIAYVQHKIGWYRMFAWHDIYGWHSSAPEFDEKESDFVTHWMPMPEEPEVSGDA